MKYLLNKYSPLIAMLAIALLFTACDISNTDSSAKQEREVAVKMKLQSSASQKIAAKQSMKANDSLSEIKLLVEELELESSRDQDSLDFELNDLIVNLPLDGSDFVLTSAVVPGGIYDEFEMEIDQPDHAHLDDPDFYSESGDEDDGYSIVIKGTYNGKEFMYRSEEDFEIEMDLNPPLEVSANGTPSVAINVDPSGWFKDKAGNGLDPNNAANFEQIDENIANSFDVEKDDDDDDDDDYDDDDDDDDDDGDDD